MIKKFHPVPPAKSQSPMQLCHGTAAVPRGTVPVLCLALCLILLASCTDWATPAKLNAEEHWPEVIQNDTYRQLAQKSVQEYWDQHHNFRQFLPDEVYDPFGDYMNWGENKLGQYREGETRAFDENGVIMVKGEDGLFHYNPVTASQQALSYYGGYLRGKVTQESFLKIADFLLTLQDEDGSFRYYYDFDYYAGYHYNPGWTSAMASGNVLSALARTYHLTNDLKYVDAAVRAIAFLDVPIEEGGTKTSLAALDPSLSNYTILEEYPVDPPTYTLNGYMFTLIGLYDWSQTGAEGAQRAKELFDEGIRTLEKILPYYDLGGYTSYDLFHITWDQAAPHQAGSYHCVHIAFCKIFYDLTGIETFNHYYTLWASYVAT